VVVNILMATPVADITVFFSMDIKPPLNYMVPI